MSRSSNVLLLIAIQAAAAFAQPVRLTAAIDDSHVVSLPGSLHPGARAQYDRGPEEPSRILPYITLTLKPTSAQQTALEKLLQDQQDRSSPLYHRWFTPEQFGDRFGLAPSDYRAVAAWLESRGLRIESRARARNFVSFSGTVEHIEQAFHTRIHRYQIDGRQYFANATELSLPAPLADLFGGIQGLQDFDRPRPVPSPHYDAPPVLTNSPPKIGPPSTTSLRSTPWGSMAAASGSAFSARTT